MNMDDTDPVPYLKERIQKEIKDAIFWENMDFALAHFFSWLSILSSFGASILIASGFETRNKILLAVIAGIPGLVIIIDKSFDFAKRASWGIICRIELEKLRDELYFGKIEPFAASQKLNAIKAKWITELSTIGFFAKKENQNVGNS